MNKRTKLSTLPLNLLRNVIFRPTDLFKEPAKFAQEVFPEYQPQLGDLIESEAGNKYKVVQIVHTSIGKKHVQMVSLASM